MNQLCKSYYFQLRNIRYIRSSLTAEAAKIVIQALVMSKLDYCNSILFGISIKLLVKLQRVQNYAARLVLTSNMEHQSSPECLQTLHWLPIKYLIQYKILLLVFLNQLKDLHLFISKMYFNHTKMQDYYSHQVNIC